MTIHSVSIRSLKFFVNILPFCSLGRSLFFQCGIVSKSGGFGQSRRGNGKVAESLEFGGGGEPFPPEGERVSPKIKMKTFTNCMVFCIQKTFEAF